MKETEYARVIFTGQTQIWGFSVRVLSSKHGVGLVRVTADGRDDLRISKAGKVAQEIPWTRIACAEPMPAPAAKKLKAAG